ncbi:hypothetical protein D3C71_448830 [compost metagenome]
MKPCKCSKCADCGMLARYGDKTKNEPHIVRSFCTCEKGLRMQYICLNGDRPWSGYKEEEMQEEESELEPCVFCGELVDASEIDERCETVICDSRECNTKYAKIQGGVN